MNERIKELAKQAGFYVADGKIYIPSTSEEITECQKKFAELIVKECCDMVNKQHQHNNPNDCLLVLDIKEHFGVEE